MAMSPNKSVSVQQVRISVKFSDTEGWVVASGIQRLMVWEIAKFVHKRLTPASATGRSPL